ncbi:hypothetical protein SELMODRAFT_419378 [Selaginella moellendorffii]|uniref:Uncharacterized protein n=1 Tax=Selaginella moellendorffii TaxID=88036 RepID=D8S8R5_SELML|nr:hypothetical protein SELMODRAFT_419378 [Selaginella moellendorffii]
MWASHFSLNPRFADAEILRRLYVNFLLIHAKIPGFSLFVQEMNIAVPHGTVNWWSNSGTSKFSVLCLGEPQSWRIHSRRKRGLFCSMLETTDLSNSSYGEYAYNCEEAKLDVDIKNGGRVSVLSSDSLPIFKHVGLGAELVKLDPHAMCWPGFSSDSAYHESKS